VAAESGDAQATVRWLAPASDGGSAIISYVLTTMPGGATLTVAGNQLSATMTGLVNGTSYTFSVAAVNAIGTGPSATSNPATPTAAATAPAAPANVKAVNDKPGQVTVTWDAPDNHGSAITNYVVSNDKDASTQNVDGSTRTAVLTKLTGGQSYTFTVTATNGIGTGPGGSSAPIEVVDVTTPTSASACGINGGAVMNVARQGGVTYRAYYGLGQDVSPTTGTLVDITATTMPLVTGLANDTTYYVVFTATNGPFESAPTTAISFTPHKGVSDTLFYHGASTINIVDCYRANPLNATPTRQIIHVKIGVGSSAGSLFVTKDGSIYQSVLADKVIAVYDHADSASGGVQAPDRIIGDGSVLTSPAGLYVDKNDRLYVWDSYFLKVFASAHSLNGSATTAAIVTLHNTFLGVYFGSVDETNDELYTTVNDKQIGVYSGASTLKDNVTSAPQRVITISNPIVNPDYLGAWFDPSSKFVYTLDPNSSTIYSFAAPTTNGAISLQAKNALSFDHSAFSLQVVNNVMFAVSTSAPTFKILTFAPANKATGREDTGTSLTGVQGTPYEVFYVP
jgi:hypothetical protein